jgi:hypothetical protein
VGAGVAIGTSRGDRVERVGHGDDARPDRDLIAGQSAGVSLPVEALVMVAYDRGQRGVVEGLHQPGPVDWVALDGGVFLVGQPPRLVENLCRRVDLADVVQRSGEPDPADLV